MHEGDAKVNLPPLARAKRGDAAPPDVTLLRRALLARLTRSRQEGGGGVATRQEWVERTAKQPLYDVSRPLARFVLLAALHDTIEVDGQLKVGKKTSQSMLTYAAWMGDAFKTIEHIAPQTRDEPSDWPEELYSEDQFERLGNLTLLPLNANQSLNNRNWKEKRVMLAALAAKTEADANRILTDAGMPVNGRIYGGSYLPFVHVLLSHESWTSEVVESRGRQLAGFAWDRLSPWIGWDV
jgi:hypothetical protein